MKKRNGVTMAEIMIAVGIMGFIILPMIGFLNYSNRGTREQEAESIAANLAKEEMNRLMYVVEDSYMQQPQEDVEWSLAEYVEKGNVFKGSYTITPYANDDLKFSLPKYKFHDPLNCPDGKEQNITGTLTGVASPLTTASSVLPSGALPVLVDIHLVVIWKLANEEDYDDRRKLELLARRALIADIK